MSSSLDQQQEHTTAVARQHNLCLKRGFESNEHGITSSKRGEKRLRDQLLPVLRFDSSDSISASYCSAALLSYLSSLHSTSEPFDHKPNYLISSPNLIGTIKQDFYTLQDHWIGRPLGFFWFKPWIPRPQQVVRYTSHLIRHYISSFNIIRDPPVISLYSSLGFQTPSRKPLLQMSLRMFESLNSNSSSSTSTETQVSLIDRLCATNNNGLSSSNIDPTTEMPIKPRCQRFRSAVVSARPNSTNSQSHTVNTPRKANTPRAMIKESHSVTEDLYDMDDDISGSMNSDEPLKSDPIPYTRFHVHSLKPPASPRRSSVISHTPSHHNRSRSSSRNGLRFEPIGESGVSSGTSTLVDDSGSAIPLNTPKPRKRYQSTTHLDCSTNLSRGDERHTTAQLKLEPLSRFSLHRTSSISGKQSKEPVPKPAQRSRGSTLKLVTGASTVTEKDSRTVRGFRIHKTVSKLECVAISQKVVARAPLRCVWMALEVCVVKHWMEPWTQLTMFIETCRIACHVRYSSSSIFRFCVFQSSKMTFYTAISIKSYEYMSSALFHSKAPETAWVDQTTSRIQTSVPDKAKNNKTNVENDYCNPDETAKLEQILHSPVHAYDWRGDAPNLMSNSILHAGVGKSLCASEVDGLAPQNNDKGGIIGLDLIHQLRGARDHVQRKLDELSLQTTEEPELLSASCDQLRTFLGQLEAYNFRVGAARTRNAPDPKQMGDTGLVSEELESLWDTVVRLTEAWLTALQKAFVQSKGLQQILTEFHRDLTFVETRLHSFLQSSIRKPISSRIPGRSWRDMTEEFPSTEEDEEEVDPERVTSGRRRDGSQSIDDVDHIPAALRLLRVIRFRLSSWFSHVNLLLLATESTQVLSSITRIQAGRPVRTRFLMDESTTRGLKQIRTSLGRLVDEAERLLTAWSARSTLHRRLLVDPQSCSASTNPRTGGTLFGAESQFSEGTNLKSHGSGCLRANRRRHFKDHDSLFSSDTDDNIEELVSVTSRSSVSLVSDGSDELVNCDQGIDTSWASEVTAQSLAPSDNTSCGLTATLSTRSFHSTKVLAEQKQQLGQMQPTIESHSISSQAILQPCCVPADPDNDRPKTLLNSSCNTAFISDKPYIAYAERDSRSSVKQNPLSVQISVSPAVESIPNLQSPKPIRPGFSWLPERLRLVGVGDRLEQWFHISPANFTQNEANSQYVQDNHIPISQPVLEPNLDPKKPFSLTSISTWYRSGHLHPNSREVRKIRFWSSWSRRSRFCDLLIGALFALLLLLVSFPFLIHILLSLPYFHNTVDVDPRSICVYRWFRLPWSQDTQEAGPGRTLAKTWPHNAPPF